MNTRSALPLPKSWLLPLLSGILSVTAPAQTAAPAPALTTANAPRNADDAVQLTKFTVSEDPDVGYGTFQTTSAMRTVQDLRNVANSISIMNSQFIEDLGLLTMEDMATWMVSGESNPDPNALVQSRIILRGFANAYALRNGWIWYSPMDSFSTERVEELRGPNAFLYGEADVGGAQNQITKRGLFSRDINRVRALVGSWELRRGEIDLNRVLVKNKLAARFAAVHSKNNSWIDNVRRDFRGFYGALTYKPFKNTSVSVMGEHDRTILVQSQGLFVDGFTRAASTTLGAIGYIHQPATGLAYRAQGRVASTGSGLAIIDPTIVPKDLQSAGPSSLYKNYTSSVTLEAEHHVGKNLHLQLTGNFYQQKLDAFGVSGRTISRDRSPLLPNGQPNPYFNELYTEYFRTRNYNGNVVRDIRLSAVYDLDLKWTKQTLIANVQQHQDTPGQKKPKYAEYVDPASANWVGTINPAITQQAFVANRTLFTNNRFIRRYYLRDGLESERTGSVDAIPGVSTWLPDLSNQIAATGQFINRRFYTPSWGVGTSGTWFKDHLYTMFGYRRDHFNMKTTRGMVRAQPDWVVDYIEAFNTPAQQFVQYKVDGANYGGVFRLNDMFALGYNYAQSFRMSVGQGAATFNNGELQSLPVGEGTDISARFSLLKGKLEINVTRYKNFTPNARYTVPGVTLQLRDELSAIFPTEFNTAATADYQTTTARGTEVEMIAMPVRNWRIRVTYADNEVSNVDRVPLLKAFRDEAKALNRATPVLDDFLLTIPEGVPNGGFTKARGNIFSNYRFSEGPLRGFSFGLGANWRLRTYRGTANVSGLATTPVINIWSPAYTLYNASLGYSTRLLKRNVSFNLNVDNLFDKEYFRSTALGSGSWGDPRSFRLAVATEL